MKKLLYISACFVTAFLMSAVTLRAQEVVLSDEFDGGDGLWNTGWIDGATTATFSIDNTSKLSGVNSYKAVVTQGVAGGGEMWHIQRIANLPLVAGNQYTVSFMAVSDSADAALNVLLELTGDPYTKRLDDTATVTNTPQTFTYTARITENVPTNQLKFMFAGARNTGKTIWIDNIVVTRIADPTLVTQWGETTQGRYFVIQNDSNTVPGTGSIAGSAPINGGGQASIRGGFGQELPIGTDEAVVVSGKLELVGTVGGESSYNPLRYAISYNVDDTLMYALTDSAYWVRSPGYGYIFTPRTGSGEVANGSWGRGTVGVLDSGNWHSTNSNGGPALETILQAPRNAQMIPGIYDWAISVQQVNDTTNEIRWYLIEENNQYWYGGIVTGPAVTDRLTGVSFNVNTGDWTEVNLLEVSARLGDPITVPEAPWEPYFLDQWGETTQGRYFVIQNDSDTFVGDGIIASGDGTPINGSGQASIRGGFGQELRIKPDEALIVTGELELVGTVGGESSYNPLRYAINYNVDDTLMYALTDSAYWVRSPGYGYIFTPRTGSGEVANGSWGRGTVGVLNNGNFHSTNSNGGPALQTILQAPRNAQMTPGTYDWAISVQQVNDTTNEIRWYLIKQHATGEQADYWFGGIVTGPAVTDRLTGVSFNVNTGDWTEVRVIEAEVDYGAPIEIPEAPWEPYFIDQWGETTQGRYFVIQNDSDTFVGDGIIASGDGTPINGSGQASIRGGFGQELLIKTDEALIVTGELELVGTLGGESSYNPLRYAINYNVDDTLMYALTDSAYWVRSPGYGYIFTPRTGSGEVANGSWGRGTVGVLNNGNFHSTNSNGGPALATILQSPRNAQMIPGTYEWAISVQQVNDSTNEIRWYLIEEDNQYWYGGIVTGPAVTDRLTGVSFNVNTGDWTEVRVVAAKVDYGAPIEVPLSPWEPYYVDQWGFSGDPATRTGGWQLEPGQFVGNVSISGAAPVPAGQWSAIRGGFETFTPSPERPLKITGSAEFVGGGFEAWSSLRLGIFYSDSAGVLDSTDEYGYVWTGSDNYNDGYLFMPHSGTNDVPTWSGPGGTGTWGGVVDAVWLSTNGASNYIIGSSDLQEPSGAVAGAGTYDFELSVTPQGDGTNFVKFQLVKDDGSYKWQVESIDDHDPVATSKFNSIAFAVGPGTATALNLTDVQVDTGTAVDVNELANNLIPTEYSLNQNYPNPFNPTTTIEFALPQTGNVSLAVYDILGRKVADLVKGNLTAGYHTVNFNASNLASGVYFYRIEAGNFVSVKKLMLLK